MRGRTILSALYAATRKEDSLRWKLALVSWNEEEQANIMKQVRRKERQQTKFFDELLKRLENKNEKK